jgi:hypothetical protein
MVGWYLCSAIGWAEANEWGNGVNWWTKWSQSQQMIEWMRRAVRVGTAM